MIDQSIGPSPVVVMVDASTPALVVDDGRFRVGFLFGPHKQHLNLMLY